MNLTPAQITKVLTCPMGDNDADAETVGAYLRALLIKLWREAADFSGKRPWGNSGWKADVAAALITNGLLAGKLDEDGYPEHHDKRTLDNIVWQVIDHIFAAPTQEATP